MLGSVRILTPRLGANFSIPPLHLLYLFIIYSHETSWKWRKKLFTVCFNDMNIWCTRKVMLLGKCSDFTVKKRGLNFFGGRLWCQRPSSEQRGHGPPCVPKIDQVGAEAAGSARALVHVVCPLGLFNMAQILAASNCNWCDRFWYIVKN